MLIVCQDRKEIINFDYGFNLSILTGTTKQVINIDGHKIAEYKTEERAKQVLNEIIKNYESKVLIKHKGLLNTEHERHLMKKYAFYAENSDVLVCDELKDIQYIPCQNNVYYMPEE